MGGRVGIVVPAAVVLLLAGTVEPTGWAVGSTTNSPSTPALRDLVASLGGDPAQAATSRYAYLAKLDSHLQELAAGKNDPALSSPGGLRVTSNKKVLVDVYVNGDLNSAARGLQAAGMKVSAISRREPERMVEGYLPIGAATRVAALESTKAVLSVMGTGIDTGSVTSQGDAAHHGPQARALGPTGAGVTAGIMSDSINKVGSGVAGSQATNDLPANVTVLGEDPSGTDEGRAMAEIVYDEAPGITNMVFDTGTTGPAAKAANIADLVNSGADVIVDDSFELNEPFFQDGTVSQAVDQAGADGTAYIAAAGNRARQSWEGSYSDAGGLNDFGGGDTRQAVADLPAHSAMTLFLQWDEPWGAAQTNFDIKVYANNSFAFSCTSNTGFPLETCGVNNGGSTPVEIEIEIARAAGSGTPKLKYIVSDNFGTFTIKEHATNSPTINPDAASAKGSLAAAAVCWSTNNANCFGAAGLQAPEAFSSRGPVIRTRDKDGTLLATPEVRQKPNVAGADGVATDLSPTSGLNPFFGTSAAVASVGGIAALALSARPTMTVSQLYTVLTAPSVSLDCTSATGDPDTDCGSGFLQADEVVTMATTPPQTTIDSGPSGTTHDPTPTFAFHSSLADSTFQCKVDAGAYGNCASPKTLAHLADGSHTFQVRAISNGLTDPTPAARSFTVNTASISVSGSTLVVKAATGAKDNLQISRPSSSTIRVTDSPSGSYSGSGVHVGAGCTRSGDYTVLCHASGITLITVASGDSGDNVVNSTGINSRLSGGTGNDVLVGGRAKDTISGGSGADVMKGMDGNDTLLARDLTSDTSINCDGGTRPGTDDSADMDLLPKDSSVTGCEIKHRH